MEDKFKVSIIIPVYNVEDYLVCCVNSILNQTYKNFELILVDDGSVDKSAEICDEYHKKDTRVKVIHKKNGGLSSARNAGLDVAKGKYIIFVDSDDFVANNFCEKLIKGIEENSAEIAICNYSEFENSDMKKECSTSENVSKDIILTGKKACKRVYGPEGVKYTVAWAKIYKKECFENIRFPVEKVHEDEYVTYKILYSAKNVLVLSETLYFYRIHSNSIMGRGFSLHRYDVFPAYDERINFFKENKEFELLAMTQKRKELLLARYSIIAKKKKIYNKVPDVYKFSFFKAFRILKKELTNDELEYFMYQYYPQIVSVYSIIKKIIKR